MADIFFSSTKNLPVTIDNPHLYQKIDISPISISTPERSSLLEVKERVRETRVCFVIPPSPFLTDERVFPFIAGPKIAAVLRENNNEVDLLDLAGYSNPTEIISDYMEAHQTTVFGITATTPQIPQAFALCDQIKTLNPDAKVILGGPHVTLTHGALQRDLEHGRTGRGTKDFNQLVDRFDTLVAGDGENAIFYAIDLENPQKVIDAGNLNSPLFMQKGELENYPFPARELIDMDSYHYYIDGHRAFSLIAQLGCPFGCGFCGGRDVQAYRVARVRDVENVMAEAEEVILASFQRALKSDDPTKALTAIMFYDDELNVSKSNLENLCESLIELQKKLARNIPPEVQEQLNLQIEELDGEKRVAMRFRGFVKAELFTQEQADLMYAAGFRILLSGVESGSDKILSAMQKGTNRAVNSRCVEYAHKAGLKFKALMSIGHPGESEETIRESIEWAASNLIPGDEIDWTVITQYPGSPYYDHSHYNQELDAWVYQIKNKRTGGELRLYSRSTDYGTDVHYYKGIPGEYKAYVWTDYLTPDQLVQMRDYAEALTRAHLNLAPHTHVEERTFEHSMGQSLPHEVLRSSKTIYQGL